MQNRPWVGYVAAVLFSVIAFALRLVVDHSLPQGYPYVGFFPAVIFTTFLFGRHAGILAGLLCGLLAWYVFIPPFYSFSLSPGTLLSLCFYAFVVAIDIALIHWMQRSNRWLVDERERSRQLIDQRELLFRELQHRVSNNLQVVAALLALQKRDVTDDRARGALDEAARRLTLIGKLHRQLHDPNGGRLGMAAFLSQLGADLIDVGGKPGIRCHVAVEEDITLDPDAAIPVALIVAEAVANALEHGLSDRANGRIDIRLARRPAQGDVELCVEDDGRGLPEGFDLASSNSLGLRIASTFARQLGGSFEIGRAEQRTVARILLPA
ncbi:sensor histidine kinase [Flavisphingomonas formosensis]|uniref:sensor histidine kinase n=1 Tax=Flavisphingomonas formosensis TaxID=861534 RepID=UPI001E35EF63|nr:histidine kinase dimerization/phosphoacceptor domain -containing protein [Sphingomonas formosensis]